MQHEILHGYRDNDTLRAQFNALAKATFGLDFEPWYASGFWNGKYDPHSIALDGRIVANVSVNRIDGTLDGEARHYIQLGTVMTDPAYRNRGLIREIMAFVLKECAESDGIYLYANDGVLDFYPKFGFTRAKETRWALDAKFDAPKTAQNVAMQTKEDWAAFLSAKRGLRSLAAFAPDTDDLYMFYLSQFMRDCVYFLPESGAYAIAETEGDCVLFHDILAPSPAALEAVCAAFGPQARRFRFAFTPACTQGLTAFDYTEEDCTFFVRGMPLQDDLARIGSFSGVTHA